MDFFKTTYIEPYHAKFIDRSLESLIREYYLIEFDIEKDLLSLVESLFNEFHFVKKSNNLFTKNNIDYYEIKSQFINSDRCLRIVIEKIGAKINLKSDEILINELGKIKSVIIEIPEDLNYINNTIVSLMKEFLINAYKSLESAFEAKSHETILKIYGNLNNVFNTKLKVTDNEALMGHCIFLLFNKDIGYHLFDKTSLTKAIQRFKKNQTKYFSPCELLIWLVTQPIPLMRSLSIEAIREDKELTKPWKETKFDRSSKFFQATSVFHEYKDYTIYPICNNKRGYSLTCIFKSDESETILPLLDDSNELLTKVFSKNISKNAALLKRLKKLQVVINVNDSAIVLGNFFGATIDTILKSNGG